MNLKSHELLKADKFWLFEGIKHFSLNNKTFILAQVNTRLPGNKSVWLPIIVAVDDKHKIDENIPIRTIAVMNDKDVQVLELENPF